MANVEMTDVPAIPPRKVPAGKVLIVEPMASGHLLVYVKLLVDWCNTHHISVSLLTSEGVTQSPEFFRHLGGFSEEQLQVICTSREISLRQMKEWAARLGAGRVVLPNADSYVSRLAAWGWRGHAVLVPLIMRDPRWESASSRRRALQLRGKLCLAMLAGRMPFVHLTWLRPPGFSGADLFACDPVILEEDPAAIREQGQTYRHDRLKLECYWFGIVGNLSPHKNVDMVVDALLRLAASRPQSPVGLALCGRRGEGSHWDAELFKSSLQRVGIAFTWDDRVLSNREFNVVVAGLDAVVIAYSTHSPNSTTSKAAALGTRIVGAGGPSMSSFLRSMGALVALDLNPDSLAEAMSRALDSDPPAPIDIRGSEQFCRALLVGGPK